MAGPMHLLRPFVVPLDPFGGLGPSLSLAVVCFQPGGRCLQSRLATSRTRRSNCPEHSANGINDMLMGCSGRAASRLRESVAQRRSRDFNCCSSQRLLSAQPDLQEIEILGKPVRLNSNVGIFVTMNPGYAGRPHLNSVAGSCQSALIRPRNELKWGRFPASQWPRAT